MELQVLKALRGLRRGDKVWARNGYEEGIVTRHHNSLTYVKHPGETYERPYFAEYLELLDPSGE